MGRSYPEMCKNFSEAGAEDTDVTIISKWIWRRLIVMLVTGWTLLKIRTNGGLSKGRWWTFGFVKSQFIIIIIIIIIIVITVIIVIVVIITIIIITVIIIIIIVIVIIIIIIIIIITVIIIIIIVIIIIIIVIITIIIIIIIIVIIGVMGDSDFRISDLVKNPDGTDIESLWWISVKSRRSS